MSASVRQVARSADLSRVVVVGTTCSGKTTFAGRLTVLLDAPHVELDALAEARD